ncbi:hypothetical protein Tco_0682889 [Tanacetum coccineum]|uniref:Uncharacterized protein n=1 Tax=Tanacetum coccineum TaxID=301880 RepID=A0ABQ4XSP3_9ASTR
MGLSVSERVSGFDLTVFQMPISCRSALILSNALLEELQFLGDKVVMLDVKEARIVLQCLSAEGLVTRRYCKSFLVLSMWMRTQLQDYGSTTTTTYRCFAIISQPYAISCIPVQHYRTSISYSTFPRKKGFSILVRTTIGMRCLDSSRIG